MEKKAHSFDQSTTPVLRSMVAPILRPLAFLNDAFLSSWSLLDDLSLSAGNLNIVIFEGFVFLNHSSSLFTSVTQFAVIY
jgi:hypothetical protein